MSRQVAHMTLHAAHVVPVWDDNGTLHTYKPYDPPRDDLADHVIGWSTVLDITIHGQRTMLLLVHDDEGIHADDEHDEHSEPDYDAL